MENFHDTLRKSQDLVKAKLLEAQQVSQIDEVIENFAMAIPPAVVGLIEEGNPDDPIARQFIPSSAELVILSEELSDPIGDEPHTQQKGITHRYPDRVLLKPLHVCPVYCRFCFRREQVGIDSEGFSEEDLENALDYIRNHLEIWEVILSGGDPLILPVSRLAHIVKALNEIEHVEVIRFHSRVPVVAPQRITEALVKALKVDTPVYVVLHCNHANELGEAARQAIAKLVDAGIPMLSQSVLLKGVNDTPEALIQLMRALTRARVKPYYLHHGDLAKGTSHFRTTIQEGQALMRAIRGNVSGICQPTYVLDIPGGYGKVPIGWNYITKNEAGDAYNVEDYQGEKHIYPR